MKNKFYFLILAGLIIGSFYVGFSFAEPQEEKTTRQILEENSLDKHTQKEEQNLKSTEGIITSPILPVLKEELSEAETVV